MWLLNNIRPKHTWQLLYIINTNYCTSATGWSTLYCTVQVQQAGLHWTVLVQQADLHWTVLYM